MRKHSARQVAQCTGVSVPQIARWADSNLIVPDLGGGGAKGKYRRFSFRNVFEVALAFELAKFQLPVRTIGTLLRFVRLNAATKIAWWGYLRDPDSRPESFTAILQYAPGFPPKLISGSSWN